MPRAGVSSIEGVTEFVATLGVFGKDVDDALGANAMEIQRAIGWLDEQVQFWKKELRVRQEEVVVAKRNLTHRKMMKVLDRHPDCTEQEQALKRAQRRLREAEQKLSSSQRWGPLLRRAVEEYQGQAQQLANLVAGDLPRRRAVLGQRLAALDAYVSLAPPTTPSTSAPAAAPAAAETTATAPDAPVPSPDTPVPAPDTPSAPPDSDQTNVP